MGQRGSSLAQNATLGGCAKTNKTKFSFLPKLPLFKNVYKLTCKFFEVVMLDESGSIFERLIKIKNKVEAT